MKLAVTICATKTYQYAMIPQARAIHANLSDFPGEIVIILVGDKELETAERFYKRLFGEKRAGFSVIVRKEFKETPGAEGYKSTAQLLIAQMRTEAFTTARAEGADLCWSFDSDVVPKTSNCFRVLKWLIDIPENYYEVAISPYPSQGGGDMLTGRGSPERPIHQDFNELERTIPDDLKERIKKNRLEIAFLNGAQPSAEQIKEGQDIQAAIDQCPPLGNVFEVNGKVAWRRRGWLSAAYPALGRGSFVPTDWCGFGNTLMSKRALQEADFLGYDGAGTEDLFVVWMRWHQVGIRIVSALHEPSGHISRRKDGKYFFSYIRFVTDADQFGGEHVGHLRTIHRPFYLHSPGEKFDAENDGIPVPPNERNQAPAIPAAPIQPATPEVKKEESDGKPTDQPEREPEPAAAEKPLAEISCSSPKP